MTLKQIAKRHDLDYAMLYQGLDDQGLLRRHHKNVEYDEKVVLNACSRYLYRRILKLRNKMAGLQADRDEIVNILKKRLHRMSCNAPLALQSI